MDKLRKADEQSRKMLDASNKKYDIMENKYQQKLSESEQILESL